jgi:hypothetical protein
MMPIPMDAAMIVDATLDSASDAKPPADVMMLHPADAGDMAIMDARPDTGVDAGMMEEACLRSGDESQGFQTPEYRQVTLAYGGESIYLVWADSVGVHQCLISPDAQFEGRRRDIESRDAVSWVTSLRAGGTTWVAYGGADIPIRVYQAHRPESTLVQLSEGGISLVGQPFLAEASGHLMVVGQTNTGALGWQIIPSNLDQLLPIKIDESGLPMPDSAAATNGGVLLRFGESGQCVFIDETTWDPVGNLPCRADFGGLVSGGSRTLLWHLEQLGAEQFLSLRSLYDPDGIVRLGKFHVPELVAAQTFRGHKPLVGRRTIPVPENRRGELQLYLAGTQAIWESMITWAAGWPWADMRAIGFLDLPEAVTLGTCDDTEAVCVDDTECGDEALCVGAAQTRHAIVVRFAQSATPVLETVPMIKQTLRTTATIFDVDPLCMPVPESCDGRDQDCDGFIDDGLCCGTDSDLRVVRERFVTPYPVEEFLIGDNEWKDAYVIAYRYTTPAGESTWQAVRAKYEKDILGTIVDLDVEAIGDCNQFGAQCLANPRDGSTAFRRTAGEGRYFNGIGGARVFIARTLTENGDDGPWGLHWIHRQRDWQGSDAAPVTLPEACDEILAVEPLKVNDAWSVVIVCRDRILRYFGPNGLEPLEWRFDSASLGRIQPIEWATIRRRLVNGEHDVAFDLLVSFRSSLGNLRLRLYDFVAGALRPPTSIEYPDILGQAGEDDLTHPIHLSIHPSGPPIRMANGQPQALFSERDVEGEVLLKWRNVVSSSGVDSSSYSILSHLLFTSAEKVDDVTGQVSRSYWAVDTLGDRGQFNLWATSPIHTETGRVVTWMSTAAPYERPLLQIVQENDEGTEFEVGAIELHCRDF